MFITFEGGEGAGKSTLSKKIYEALKSKYTPLMTREPGGTVFGEKIREMLLFRQEGMKISLKAELFLFEAARIQHIEEVILPALKRGQIVLCDRFSDSTIAYQGAGRNVGVEYVKTVDQLATAGLMPDLTFFVDIDPQVGLGRVKKRSQTSVENGAQNFDSIESEALAFHERVRVAFQMLAQTSQGRIIVLDGNLSEEELFKIAFEHIQKKL
jgi:dTMP kinase